MEIDISVYAGWLAFLAFIMAFYGLAARERKTPYIISTIYSTIFLVLLSVIFDLIGRFSRPFYPNASEILFRLAKATLILSVFYVAKRIWSIYIMHINFRDDQLWNFPPIKQIRNIRKSRKVPKYEHAPVPINERLVNDIIQSGVMPKEQLQAAIDRNYPKSEMKLSISAVCVTPNWSSADRTTLSLISNFLRNDCLVQYTACARHPIDLMLHLKNTWVKNG